VITSLLRVTGMTCNGCVKHVDAALRAVPGVAAVEVLLFDQRAKVVHDPERSPVPILLAAVEGAGYEATPVEAEAT
jgi:copper chaperone CopZ